MNILNCKVPLIMYLLIVLSACTTVQSEAVNKENEAPHLSQNNLLANLSEKQLGKFSWMNPPDKVRYDNGILSVTSETKTDFFIDPESNKPSATAPVLYQEVKGDFIATALVKPDLSGMWNAGSIMVFIGERNWIKFAFENSDATGNSIVTVVTRDVSDDANGVVIEDVDKVWLKLVRKGDIYSMHWSKDGKKYFMARLSKMPASETVKVGLEAQCPVDKAATHEFHYFSIEHKSVEKLRNVN